MLQSVYFWILVGAFGLFFGIANSLFHIPILVLFYPASLYILAKISKNPFRDGTLCGLIGASFSMYWISTAVHFYGYFPWIIAIPCAMVMGTYIGLWGGMFSFIMQRMLSLDPLLRAFSATLFWYICEWIRSFLFTGFSWITLSSAFAPMPEFIQTASVIGAFGLSGVFAGIAVLLIESFTNHIFPDEIKPSYTKNALYKSLISFSGVLLLGFLFLYGNVRLTNSFDDNTFLYGTDTNQPYMTIENMVANPRKDTDLQNPQMPQNTQNMHDYQEYHKNPQYLGIAKHTFVLPNFLNVFDDKKIDSILVENNIAIPRTFLEQDNIALFTAVQGNVSQAVKWDKSFQLATVQKYIRLSEQSVNFVTRIFPFIDFREKSALLENDTMPSSIITPLDTTEAPSEVATPSVSNETNIINETSTSPLVEPATLFIPSSKFTLAIPSVVLWPETALPFYFQHPSPLSSMVWNFANEQKIIFGSPGFNAQLYEEEGIRTLYNRLFFLQDNNLSHYDKEHLVPFGEYVPAFSFIPDIFSNLLQGVGGFNVGENDELLMIIKSKRNNLQESAALESATLENVILQNAILESAALEGAALESDVQEGVSHPLSSLICYEAIFPHIARRDVKNGAELFINVSNDAWYDRTSAAEQHLHLSLMRTVEQKRFLVRAGNTGISAFVDDYGRIMAQSDLFTDETVSGFVAFRTEKTIYYYLAPYLPGIAISLFLMLFIYGQIWAVYLKKARALK